MKSRFGLVAVIKIGQAVLITPCDTRIKILEALSNGELTSDAIAEATGASYSCVMDHIDLLEKLGVVESVLRRNGGRRRVYFHLSEDPLEGIEKLFLTAPKGNGGSAESLGPPLL
ncbi:MAG: winged helix-turn-helix domain-containing protein [Candidatus Sulfotelmatobacter sp.]